MTSTRLVTNTPLLRASLRQAPVVRLKGYDYFVHPITDGIPRLDAALLSEVTEALCNHMPPDADVILTPEAMGIPLASGVGLKTGKPFTVARKRAYGLPGEIIVEQRTGYGASRLHVHGIKSGDRVVIVDDVVSTGGTLRAIVRACREAKADVLAALVVVNKGVDLTVLQQELGIRIQALVRLRLAEGRVLLED